MLRNRKPVILLIALVLLLQMAVFPIVNAEDPSYYRVLAPKAYKIKSTFVLKNTGTSEAFNVKAILLAGSVSSSPYQQNISYKVTPWPKYTYVDPSGNIYAEVHIDRIKAGETKIITVEKDIINSGIYYSRDIYRMNADYTEFLQDKSNAQYLEPGEKIEINAPEIKAKAAGFNTNQTPVELAKDIYDFVNTYITYDLDSKYANKGALSAIKTARGVCDEYATLFTALSRALGLPARVVTGYWLDEPLKMGVWNDVSTNAHAWAEFYLPQAGWIPVEPTFIYTYNGVRTPNSDYFANIKADDVHLINGYQPKKIKSDISIVYSYYKPTSIEIEIAKQEVMPVRTLYADYAFADISTNWARDYINKLYNMGILFAKQPGLYKPADNITRAEFAAYLVNALKLEPVEANISFKDVKDSSDYAAFIKTAAAYKLITGDPQGYFKPNDPITRQDAAVIMQRALEMLDKDIEVLYEPKFADMNQISPYANGAVKLIYSMQIMTGKPGNIFDPKSFTTRAEASKILDNFINAAE